MRRYELFEPTSLEEGINLLIRWGEKGLIFAGGTDLIPQLKKGEKTPEALIAMRQIPGFCYIQREGDSVKLGAFTTHRAIEKSSQVRSFFPALADAVDNLGSIQVRNIATIGGNICNAAPSADTVPPLLVHHAKLSLHGLKGERVIPLEEFFDGQGKTRLGAGEILKEIILPLPSMRTSSVYIKLTRRSSMELPLLGVAARVSFDPAQKILDGSIALACAGLNCFRAKIAETLLPGKTIQEQVLKEIGRAVLEESNPRDSFRCSAQYRREMIPILVARALRQCYDRSLKEGERSL